MIEVSLFVDGEFIDKMDRRIVPIIGEEIIIDCGESVRVITVSHQWDNPFFVQVNCIEIKEDKKDE